MILIIDNYDSFTYNLYQYIGEINSDVLVYRNDKITIDEIRKLNPTHIILSPGPGFPSSAGITIEVIKKLHKEFPILGVCLGHQAIGEAFGGNVVHAKELVHGKAVEVTLTNCKLFKSIQNRITVGRYHSLIVESTTLPDELEVIAKTDDDQIMGIKHKKYEVYGIQFHPESLLTSYGKEMLRNFID